MMLLCWRHSPKLRPHFSSIVRDLNPDIDSSFQKIAFVFSEEYLALEERAAAAAEAQSSSPPQVETMLDEDSGDGDDDLFTPLTQSREQLDCSHIAVDIELDTQHRMCQHGQVTPRSCACSDNDLRNDLRRVPTSPSHTSGNSAYHSSGPASDAEPGNRHKRGGQTGRGLGPRLPSEHSSLSGMSQLAPSVAPSYSSEGSKESSKSSGSSHHHLNGLLNGHIPHPTQSQPC